MRPGPGDPQRTVVHLLRHGEVHNPHRLLYGRLPGYHLSELGRQMAHLAAEHLGDHDITHVVSSPLERARETAAPIADSHGLEVTLDERVIEAENYFEGLPVAGGSGILKHPRLYPKMLNPFRPSWGEPYVEIVERVRRAVVDARAAARGQLRGRHRQPPGPDLDDPAGHRGPPALAQSGEAGVRARVADLAGKWFNAIHMACAATTASTWTRCASLPMSTSQR